MKRASIICSGVCVITMAIACLARAEKEVLPATAEEAVKAMVSAAMKQDIEAAKAFMDEGWIKECEFIFQKRGGVKGYWAKLTKDFTVESVEVNASQMKDDVTFVPVSLTYKDKTTMVTTYKCQKKNDRWIVLGIK